jgi:hypothetical protein
LLGRATWSLVSVSAANIRTVLNDTVGRGYTAIEVEAPIHDALVPGAPAAGNGALPFTLRLDAGAWSGTTFSNNNQAPDMSVPNATYWDVFADLVRACWERGVVVKFFPCYMGFSATDGWRDVVTANGTTKMTSYGQWIGARFKAFPNILWMAGGDEGVYTAAERDGHQAMIDGIQSQSPASTLWSALWDDGQTVLDQADFAAEMTVNGSYSGTTGTAQVTLTASLARTAYSASASHPALLLEEPYDEAGPDGDSSNSNATQPVRRYIYWGWLGTIGGYCSGNTYVWKSSASPSYLDHLNTQNDNDMQRLNAFIASIRWYDLIPSGLNGMGTIVTSSNTVDTSTYVAAAATAAGTLLLAYRPPAHTSTITINMAVMSGTTRSRWWDPTTGNYTADATGLSNIGTRVFTVPGTNSVGENDWLLVLDA